MIKLVASDVDGTLVKEGSSYLNPELEQVIRELRKKGIIFVAASGRQYMSMEHLFDSLKDDIYFITSNGGYVMYQGQMAERRCMDSQVVSEVVDFCRKQENSFYLITTPETDYTDCDDLEFVKKLREEYHIKIQCVEDVLAIEGDVLKISIYGKGIDAIVMSDRAKGVLHDKAMILGAGDHWVDIMAAGADKGAALESLQKKLNISKEETMAFGDNMNDIGLFRVADEGYAVATARDAVKEAAKYVMEDGPGKGPLKILRELLLKFPEESE